MPSRSAAAADTPTRRRRRRRRCRRRCRCLCGPEDIALLRRQVPLDQTQPPELQVTFRQGGQLRDFGPLPSFAQAELVCDILSGGLAGPGTAVHCWSAGEVPLH